MLFQYCYWITEYKKKWHSWRNMSWNTAKLREKIFPFQGLTIFNIESAWIGGNLDWQKLCHNSIFCSASLVSASYTSVAILRAASLASGSLSFSKSAATSISSANPNCSISSRPCCSHSHTNLRTVHRHKNNNVKERVNVYHMIVMSTHHLWDTRGERSSSLGPDPKVFVTHIYP